MKHLIRLLTFVAVVATFALPAFAQGNPCEEQARTDLYTKYYNEKKDTKNQKPAFETGKEYLQKYGSCNDQYTAAVKKFVDAYEKASGKFQVVKLIEQKKYPEAFTLGKQVLASTPDDIQTIVQLAWGGLSAATSGNTSLNADTANFAQRAIQLIESGKTPENWAPFTSRDDTLGWMHYVLGTINLKSKPAEAANHLVKAAQFNSSSNKEPTVYYYLAFAYQQSEYKDLAEKGKKLYEDLQKNFVGKPESPESKAATAEL